MTISTEIKSLNDEFAGFTGTAQYYQHWLGGVFTDGIKAMADKFKAYWLLDIPFTYQTSRKVTAEKFQIWTITSEDKKAVIEMKADDGLPVIVRVKIEYTTFPEGVLKMYYIDDGSYKVLLLPSEY